MTHLERPSEGRHPCVAPALDEPMVDEGSTVLPAVGDIDHESRPRTWSGKEEYSEWQLGAGAENYLRLRLIGAEEGDLTERPEPGHVHGVEAIRWIVDGVVVFIMRRRIDHHAEECTTRNRNELPGLLMARLRPVGDLVPEA